MRAGGGLAQRKVLEGGGGPALESKRGKEDTQAGDTVAAQCVASEPSTVSSAGTVTAAWCPV